MEKLRRDSGMSLREVSKISGVNPSTVHRMEKTYAGPGGKPKAGVVSAVLQHAYRKGPRHIDYQTAMALWTSDRVDRVVMTSEGLWLKTEEEVKNLNKRERRTIDRLLRNKKLLGAVEQMIEAMDEETKETPTESN